MESAEVLADVAVEVVVAAELIVELEARVEIQQPGELKVLLVAVHYWDSLKS